MNSEKRKIYIDVLKIISIFSVMYVHTGLEGVLRYEVTQGIEHYLFFFLGEFAKTCSYMFFVISGALLLKRDEPLKVLFTKRVFRYAILIFLAGSIRLICYNVISGTKLTFADWFSGIYSTNVIEQYWFLHAYLAFLLILPFLRMIARSLTKETAIYLLALLVIFNFVLPYFEALFDLGPISISIPLFEDIIILPLMGYCIEEPLSPALEKRSLRLGAYILALVVFAVDLIYAYRMYKAGNEIPRMNGSYMLMTFGLYILGRQIFKAKERNSETSKLEKIICIMGASTLTIIVFEPEIRGITHPLYTLLSPYISAFLALIIWLIAALILGSLMSWLIKKIPFIKKLF